MSLNHYWEKYKNRNKSQDLIYPSNEKPVPNSIIYDHLSSLQAQMNHLETKILDLTCKFNSLNPSENPSHPDPVLQKVERLEKTLEIKSELETRFKIQKEAQSSYSESLRSEVLKELIQVESRISKTISNEVRELNFRIKEINEAVKDQAKVKTQNFTNENKEDRDWQRKIEKIVVACAEKVKKIDISVKEGQNFEVFEQIQQDLKKFKGFQIKVKRKMEEFEELSKKICRKMIESEMNSVTASPSSKKMKLESSLSLTQKKENEKASNHYSGFSSAKKVQNKKDRLETPVKKETSKGLNRLEKLYEELSEL